MRYKRWFQWISYYRNYQMVCHSYVKQLHHRQCSAQGQVLHCKLQFCRRHISHCKLRNQCCSFTRDWIGAVASRCFPHPTLSLASEQTLKDPEGTNVEVRRLDLANWALRTSPIFTTGFKYQFHQGFWLDQRSGNPNHPSPRKTTY